jgi:RNA-dependent RNA polymerase
MFVLSPNSILRFAEQYAPSRSSQTSWVYISILHLRVADLKGPDSQDCMDLAELASHAVDYCKTGTPVNPTKLPRPPQIEKPDFLSREWSNERVDDRFYRSEKILGTLFRRILVDDYSPASYHGELAPSDGAKVREYLCPIVSDRLGSTFLEHPPEVLVEEMGHFLEAYCDRLLVIAQTHTLSKHPDSKLSEEELVSGTIMANWADHHKRREAVNAINLQVRNRKNGVYHYIYQFSSQTQQLTKSVRAEFARGFNPESADNEGWDSDDSDDEELDNRVQIETLKRAWVAWNVAEDALQDDPEVFGPSSFGLVALGVILKIIKNLVSICSATPVQVGTDVTNNSPLEGLGSRIALIIWGRWNT